MSDVATLMTLLQEATSYLVEHGFKHGAGNDGAFLDRVAKAIIEAGGRVETHVCELCGKTFHEEADGDFGGGSHATSPDSDDRVWVCNPCDERNTEEARQDLLLHPHVPPYVPERY